MNSWLIDSEHNYHLMVNLCLNHWSEVSPEEELR
jgi:hypothetical protein